MINLYKDFKNLFSIDLFSAIFTRRGKHYGKQEWIENFWLGKMQKPYPEPYSIRQVFYEELPRITSFLRQKAPYVLNYPNWARDFHQSMISIMSDMFLEGKTSYRKINLFEDSGASKIIWQDTIFYENADETEAYPEYPIEVWIEKNATYNCLKPLLEDENREFQINMISQKGFAKSCELENLVLDRIDDVKVILCLTDYDPSGYFMPQDLQDRLKKLNSEIKVISIGLFPQQIPQQKRTASLIRYKEKTDPRTKLFKELNKNDRLVQKGFGYETQALNPTEIRTLVSNAITKTIKENKFVKKT